MFLQLSCLAMLLFMATTGVQPLAIKFTDCSLGEVKRVNLTGCDMSVSNEDLCVVDRGTEMFLEVDFIPDRDYDVVESHIVAHISNWVNLDLPGIELQACGNYLECPLKGGQVTNLQGRAFVPSILPRIKTRITAKLVDPETNDMPACGTVNVRIR